MPRLVTSLNIFSSANHFVDRVSIKLFMRNTITLAKNNAQCVKSVSVFGSLLLIILGFNFHNQNTRPILFHIRKIKARLLMGDFRLGSLFKLQG